MTSGFEQLEVVGLGNDETQLDSASNSSMEFRIRTMLSIL